MGSPTRYRLPSVEAGYPARKPKHGDRMVLAPFDTRQEVSGWAVFDAKLDMFLFTPQVYPVEMSDERLGVGLTTYQLSTTDPPHISPNEHRRMFERVCEAFSLELVSFEPTRFAKDHSAGPVSSGTRFDILKRDDYQCQLCGRTASEDGVKLHVDHKKPKARGGTNHPNNLWTLCRECNVGKGTKSL